jgi:shikimate 5-dehydrogenase
MTNPTTGTGIFTFIGVTTGKSAIMRIFPAWAQHLGLGDVAMAGVDLALHAPPEAYRGAVEVIRSRPEQLGALVTTHKIDLYRACRDMFGYIDPYAELCGEVSSLSKRDGQFRAHAKDPISSGRALDEFIEPGYFAAGSVEGAAGGAGVGQGAPGPEALLFGAGGSNLAITLHLMRGRPEGDRPPRIVVVNRSPARLESMRAVHEQLGGQVKVEYVHNADPAENDRLMAEMPPGSLVVNGTGMGKDSPGSPITDGGAFPQGARVWELNYRGELDFLHQARRQEARRALFIEDGWRYFVHGWTCVMEEVFAVPMTPDVVEELSRVARGLRST